MLGQNAISHGRSSLRSLELTHICVELLNRLLNVLHILDDDDL